MSKLFPGAPCQRRGGATEFRTAEDGHRLMPWSARFADPIILPGGRKLLTLRDAATYHGVAEGRARCRRMADRNGDAVAGGRARRPGDAGADGHDAGAESAPRGIGAGAARQKRARTYRLIR